MTGVQTCALPIYPTELYGQVLNLKLEIAPYFLDTQTLADGTSSGRAWLSNFHYYVGFFYLQGHLWHGLRAMGFDFKRIGKLFNELETSEISAG